MKDIHKKKTELYKQSKSLREAYQDCDNFDQAENIKKKQNKIYKKFKFYQNYLEAVNDLKGKNENSIN